MVINATEPMLITFSAYLCLMVFIGIVAYHTTKNFTDYILGGRKIGSFVTALSAGASDMSGWLLLGLPGLFYAVGLSEVWMAVGLLIGAWCNWRFVAGRLRVHTEYANNSLTLPDYFTHRFQDKQRILRIISSFVILLFFTVYCASGIAAGAQLFHSTFGFTYFEALLLGAAATVIYTFLGGFLAVSWTDTVQASLMIFALILTPLVIIFSLGGFTETLSLMEQNLPNHSNLMPELGFIAIISALGWGLGYFGQPHILTRFMATSSHHNLKRARRISISWMALCLIGAMSIGYFGAAYFIEHPSQLGIVAENRERIFIQLTMLLFNPWVAGIILSAILAAIMSTLSSQLLICSSSITQDFYKGLLRPQATERELIVIGRLMVLIIAGFACFLALNPNSSILGLVSYAWAGLGAAFGPVILFSLLWARMTRGGALAGMIAGALTVILWKQYAQSDLYELIPGFAIASLAIILVSLLNKAPTADMLEPFEAAQRAYKAAPQEIDNWDGK